MGSGAAQVTDDRLKIRHEHVIMHGGLPEALEQTGVVEGLEGLEA